MAALAPTVTSTVAPTVTATLVMQSEGYAPQVRSHGYTASWSRLYQSDGLFVDLCFTPKRHQKTLTVQVLSADGVPAPVSSLQLVPGPEAQQGDTLQGNLDGGGYASFGLEHDGDFDLVVELAEATLVIPNLPVG